VKLEVDDLPIEGNVIPLPGNSVTEVKVKVRLG
jgi:hypothetical protein